VVVYLGKDKPGDRPGYAEEEALAAYESTAAWRVGLGSFQSVYVIGTNDVLLAGTRRLSNAWLTKQIPEIGRTREVMDMFDPSGESADALLDPQKKGAARRMTSSAKKSLPKPKARLPKGKTKKTAAKSKRR